MSGNPGEEFGEELEGLGYSISTLALWPRRCLDRV